MIKRKNVYGSITFFCNNSYPILSALINKIPSPKKVGKGNFFYTKKITVLVFSTSYLVKKYPLNFGIWAAVPRRGIIFAFTKFFVHLKITHPENRAALTRISFWKLCFAAFLLTLFCQICYLWLLLTAQTFSLFSQQKFRWQYTPENGGINILKQSWKRLPVSYLIFIFSGTLSTQTV